MATIAPYGSWTSPITPDLLVEKVVGLSHPMPAGDDLLWVEFRPEEGGRYALVRRRGEGSTEEALPPDFAVRTLVHEYGGLCYTRHAGTVFFSNYSDQRLYRADPGATPTPITPDPAISRGLRYADPAVSPNGAWLICVRETHSDDGVVNDVVVLPTDGSSSPRTIADGHDFYSAPRFSPEGDRVAWITWDQPRMPWDGTELWEAEVGNGFCLGPPRLVAGGLSESITQPRYSPSGVLHYISDRTGWWNLYADDGQSGAPLAPKDCEFSGPDWVFGQSTYTFLADGTVVAKWSEAGLDHLGYLAPGGDSITAVELPYTSVDSIRPFGFGVVAVVGSPTEAPAIVAISFPSQRVEVLKRSRQPSISAGYLSAPRAVEFTTGANLTAHALFYAPANEDFRGPEGDRPPLVVMCHGGPTSATSSVLSFGIQFWTSRGLAVVDVNYGGSTGYGRAYRRRLQGNWGIVDVDDCVNAALHLAKHGEVDRDRMVIRGGSAGGYTTLCALTFRNVFAGGASLYGVADAGALAVYTHKFEARYLDGLIGPWPEARALYEERSPIFHTDRLRTPVILFQGLEDEVVPPAQADMMADALRTKGVPFAHISFPGEQHGFRKVQNIKRTAEAELWFYGKILGFEPAGTIEPVVIENL